MEVKGMLAKVLEVGRVMKHEELYRNFAKPVDGIVLALQVNLEPTEYKNVVRVERILDPYLLLYTDQKGNVSGKSPTVTLIVSRDPEETGKNVDKSFEKFRRFFQGEEATKDLEKLLTENYKEIIDDIKKEIADISEKKAYLTIFLWKDDKELKPA
jgi:CRISPR-associated protein Csh1